MHHPLHPCEAGRKLGCQWLSHSQPLVRLLFSCYPLKVAFFFPKQHTVSWSSEACKIWTRHYKGHGTDHRTGFVYWKTGGTCHVEAIQEEQTWHARLGDGRNLTWGNQGRHYWKMRALKGQARRGTRGNPAIWSWASSLHNCVIESVVVYKTARPQHFIKASKIAEAWTHWHTVCSNCCLWKQILGVFMLYL